MLSVTRCADAKDKGWIEAWADKYIFVTNGRKLYRGADAIAKKNELHYLDVVEYEKCNLEEITKQLEKHHPETPELAMLKQMKLIWMYVGVYTPFGKNLIRYFFIKEQANVIHGRGTTHLNDDYVSYSTVFLNGMLGQPTYESLMSDQNKLNKFVQSEIETNSFG